MGWDDDRSLGWLIAGALAWAIAFEALEQGRSVWGAIFATGGVAYAARYARTRWLVRLLDGDLRRFADTVRELRARGGASSPRGGQRAEP